MFKKRILIELRRIAEWRARSSLQAHQDLWSALQEYLLASKSTGCNYSDYWHLYKLVRMRKPTEVLECGTGVSTLVIAKALAENARETNVLGRVTSMEEHEIWLNMSQQLLPLELHSLVDFRLSSVTEDCFSLFRGVRYRDIPDREYDFVFIDGPSYTAPSDGALTFDFDFLHVVLRARKPVSGLVDKRVSTCYVLQQILGYGKVQYSPIVHLGFIAPVTRCDLREIPKRVPSLAFEPSFRILGPTHLALWSSQSEVGERKA